MQSHALHSSQQSAISHYEAGLDPIFQREPLLSLHAKHAFETLEKLGAGGMGEVYKVLDKRLGRLAALKLMHPQGQQQLAAQQRFLREAEITARLDHPAIPPVYEAGKTTQGQLYLLMRLIRGRTLKSSIEQAVADESLEEQRRELLQALIRVGEAVAYAHEQGIIHRDLKPENIMLGEFGEVLVLDWGVAKDLNAPEIERQADDILKSVLSKQDLSQAGLTVTGAVVGTPGYMSPQQICGEAVDGRADVFSLGLILVELLTGVQALSADTMNELYARTASGSASLPHDIDGAIAKELNWIAAQALEATLEKRTQSAREFVAQLQCYVNDENLDDYPYSLIERSVRFVRRRPGTLMGLTASLFCLLFLAFLTSLWLNLEREKERSARLSFESKAALEKEAKKRRLAEDLAESAQQVLALFNEARALVRRGAPNDQVVARLELALTISGESETDLLTAAKIYEDIGEWVQAKRLLKDVADKHPPAYDALFSLHTIELKETGQEFFLSSFLKKIVSRAKERGDVNEFTLFVKANELRDQGRFEESLKVFEQIEKFTKTASWVYLNKGRVYRDLESFDKAFACYEKAIELSPRSYFALNGRGNIHVKRGNWEQAFKDYHRAIRLNPDVFLAYYNLGVAFQQRGQLTQALEAYDKALQRDSSDEGTLINRAQIFIELKQYDKALADYERSIKSNPKSVLSYCNRGVLYQKLGRYNEALSDYNKAVQLGPKDAWALFSRAYCRKQMKNFDAAIADYDAAIQLNPKFFEAYHNRGLLNQSQRKHDAALADFDSALQLKPDSKAVIFNRALLLKVMGRLEEALSGLNEYMKADLNYAYAYYHRGLIYQQLKNRRAALTDLKAFLRLMPRGPSTAKVQTLIAQLKSQLSQD